MLKWEGERVKRKMFDAITFGINKTMEDSVVYAKNNHPWVYRTGKLERSIKIAEFAKQVQNGFIGVWGSVATKYAIFLELGTSRMRAFPFLRPSADVNYRNLAGHIQSKL
jgi:HK97 gp10 family phage protein